MKNCTFCKYDKELEKTIFVDIKIKLCKDCEKVLNQTYKLTMGELN